MTEEIKWEEWDVAKSLKTFIGRTFDKIENTGDELKMTSGEIAYTFFHSQDCCENVTIEDVCGDLTDLIGTPLLVAEEITSDKNPEGIEKEYQDDSFTWTFYKFSTIKGSVTIRWYGESNGYYSEGVDLKREFIT